MAVENEQTYQTKKPGVSLGRLLVLTIFAGAAGFGGSYLYDRTHGGGGSNNSQVQKAVDNESSLITKIAETTGQSVVSINASSKSREKTLAGSFDVTRSSAGTGFILNEDGVVVTNRHVVPSGVNNVSVVLSDGTELDDVSVIGRTSPSDPLDIAFLKINDKKGKDLKPVKLGDSTKVEVGERVVAIGNALGQFQNTVTSGIISGYGRSVVAEGDSGSSDTLQNLFQTDTSINEGNSGGPLVNIDGEVIGINTAVAGNAENIGFAIPISDVQGIIKSVLKDGRLLRPFLGIRYVNLTDDIAYKLKLDTKRGAYILPKEGSQASIVPGSAADKAGLRTGDIIARVNDIDINDKNSLASVLGRFSVGDKVNLTVVRSGETINLSATLQSAGNNL